jgi:undecaprenyl diphosphate synthase
MSKPCTNSSLFGYIGSLSKYQEGFGRGAVLYPCPRSEALTTPYAFEKIALVLPLLFGLLLGSYLQKTFGNQSYLRKTKLSMKTTTASSLWSSPVQKRSDNSRCTKAVQTNLPTVRNNRMEPNYEDTVRQSGIDPSNLPVHIAVIMDGNRRYGERTYGVACKGHLDGGKKAIQFVEWCHTEGVAMVTMFAFSSENWNRSREEVNFLMKVFEQTIVEELRPLVFNRQIRFNHLFTDNAKIPASLLAAVDSLRNDTKGFKGTTVLNVCMSYGGRPEIVNATQSIARLCINGTLKPEEITEGVFSSHLTTAGMPEPEILFRTSGEYRLSNFMLWQLAYAELFFGHYDWPEVEKEDLLTVLREFGQGRQRRFGR